MSSEFGDSGGKGGDPFCDPSQGSSAHICMSCVLSMKLCVFETPGMRFTFSEINDTTLKGILMEFDMMMEFDMYCLLAT